MGHPLHKQTRDIKKEQPARLRRAPPQYERSERRWGEKQHAAINYRA